MSNNSTSSSSDKISASGRIVRVAPKYAYIHSDQYGSIFSYPAAYFNNCLPTTTTTATNETNNLTDVLRVDDIVHFVAVPQNGQNDCKWIAIKITKKPSPTTTTIETKEKIESSSMSRSSRSSSIIMENPTMPETIGNICGTIIELYDRNGYIYSERYGKIYFPMAAAVEWNNDELHPLNMLFENGQTIVFDAQRQPYKNDCWYVAVRVWMTSDESSMMVQQNDESRMIAMQKEKRSSPPNPISVDPTATITAQPTEGAIINYDQGEIVRLFAQYGFIRSETLGTVYFTLNHVDSESYVANLSDALCLGDTVRFAPMHQAEKNGCRWRGLHVRKIEPDLITPLARLLIDKEGGGDQSSTTGGIDGEQDQDQIVCEVSSQTDQNLWNAFLATQASAGSGSSKANSQQRGRRTEQDNNNAVETKDATCQTVSPPEAFLLKAVKEDDELKSILAERFPHLMRYIDKKS